MSLLYKSLQFENCARAEKFYPSFFRQSQLLIQKSNGWTTFMESASMWHTWHDKLNAKIRKSQDWLQWLGHIFFSSLYFLLRYFPLVLADMSNLWTQEVWSQGKTMSRRRGEESCPFLDGVYVSVMRRSEPLSIWWPFSSIFFETDPLNITFTLLNSRIINPGFHKQLLSEVELMLTTTLLPDRLYIFTNIGR